MSSLPSVRRLFVLSLAFGAIAGTAACGDGRQVGSLLDDDYDDYDGRGSNAASEGSDADVPEEAPVDPNANNTSTASLDVSLDQNVAEVELIGTTTLTVTVTPKSDFTGTVNLSATGLPEGATATFVPATLEVTSATPLTAKLEIAGATSSTPTPAAVKVVATSGALAPTAGLSLNVVPKLTLTIPPNVARAPNAFGVGNLSLKVPNLGAANPFVVTFLNKDARSLVIHASGTNFPHGRDPVPRNGTMVRSVTAPGNYSAYIHDLPETNPSTRITLAR